MSFVFLILIPGTFIKIFAQAGYNENYQYLSPLPNTILVQPGTDIIIRQGNEIDESTLNEDFIEIRGSKSGIHKGKIDIANDNKTLIYKPFVPFSLGETVKVFIRKGIKEQNGEYLIPIKYQFRILEKRVSVDKYLPGEGIFPIGNKIKDRADNTFKYKINISKTELDSIPPDFPYLDLMVNNNPSPGEIFIAPFQFLANSQFGYLLILENDGLPVYYKRFDYVQLDFKLQSNGGLTYFNSQYGKYYEMNTYYTIIDSFECKNGYATDLHELYLLPDGHAFIIANDYEYVRMDTVVAGGDSNATVIGNIIQELDEEKNVVFQWRSWDHFKITDATQDIDLTGSSIDYVHCNSIEEDNDGNLIISCRHMDEVTKINRQTGDIIWRLGGEYCKNNQFTFINDSAGFSHQHDARRMPNGNLTLFDNGNLHSPQYSRACEYQLDETLKTVSLVWQYENDPLTFTTATGSVRRLHNNNTLIGWGINNGPPDVSEIHQDNSIGWAASFPDNVYSYRAFKYFWKTNYFVTNPDSVTFANVPLGESDSAEVVITNNSDSILTINDVFSSDSAFSLIENLPVQIPSHSNINLNIKFTPMKEEESAGWIHLVSNRYTEMIGQTIFVRGTTDSVLTNTKNNNIVKNYSLYQNYPNPFNPTTKIGWVSPVSSWQTLKLYDVLGNEVATLVNEEKPAGNYEINFDGSNLSSGVYFYQLKATPGGGQAGSLVVTKKMLLLK
jgi:hypothetical protein